MTGGQGGSPPVVLLHGFPLSQAMWRDQHDGLGTRLRLLTPDLPGFGDAPRATTAPDLGTFADAVLAMLDRLGLGGRGGGVVLGGLSMGGYVAMEILRRRPEVVAGLLLADTKASADPQAGRETRLGMADRLERTGSSRILVEEVLPTLLGQTTRQRRPQIADRVREMVAEADPVAAAWAQRAMAARPDSLGTLRGVSVPALVVVGEEDTLSPPADAQAMVDALPQGELVTVPGAGHLSAMETPDAFDDAVAALVDRLGAGGLSAGPGA